MDTNPPPISWRTLCILALILAAAAVVRCYQLGRSSTWFDERAAVMSATGHLGDFGRIPLNQVIQPPDLTTVRNQAPFSATWHTQDFHPPLYAVVLRWWRQLFGESDEAARSLSVVASLAAILFFFDLSRLLFSPAAALWACAIMAIAQPQIEYAQEARDYALWLSLGMAAGSAAARLVRLGPNWKRVIALAICVDALLLTHFLAIGSLAALAVWCGVWLRGRALKQTAIAVSVGLLILVPIAGGIIGRGMNSRGAVGWLNESPVHHVQYTVERLALLPACFLAEPLQKAKLPAGAGVVVFVLPWLLSRRNPGMLWCALWLTGGVGLVALLDLVNGTQGLLYSRFTVAATPACYLVIAALPVKSYLRMLLPLTALAACLLALPNDYDPTFKGQWRELGHEVRQLAQNGDVIVFASPPGYFLADPQKMYEGVAYYGHPIACPVVLIDQPPDEQTSQRLRQAARVWVVTPPENVRPSEFLPGWRIIPAARNCRFAGSIWQALPQQSKGKP